VYSSNAVSALENFSFAVASLIMHPEGDPVNHSHEPVQSASVALPAHSSCTAFAAAFSAWPSGTSNEAPKLFTVVESPVQRDPVHAQPVAALHAVSVEYDAPQFALWVTYSQVCAVVPYASAFTAVGANAIKVAVAPRASSEVFLLVINMFDIF